MRAINVKSVDKKEKATGLLSSIKKEKEVKVFSRYNQTILFTTPIYIAPILRSPTFRTVALSYQETSIFPAATAPPITNHKSQVGVSQTVHTRDHKDHKDTLRDILGDFLRDFKNKKILITTQAQAQVQDDS